MSPAKGRHCAFIAKLCGVVLKYDRQKHFEFFLAEHGMRVLGRHYDSIAPVQDIFRSVNRDFSGSVKADDHCVAARFMGADLLALVKGKKRYAQCGILRKSFADHLTRLIFNLLLKLEDLCLAYILVSVHNQTSSGLLSLIKHLKILFV